MSIMNDDWNFFSFDETVRQHQVPSTMLMYITFNVSASGQAINYVFYKSYRQSKYVIKDVRKKYIGYAHLTIG